MFTRQLPAKKKSCSHCVKAKRKCDLAYPKCSRCSKQSLSCEYPYAEMVLDPDPPQMPFDLPVLDPDLKMGYGFDSAVTLDFLSTEPAFMLTDEDFTAMPSFDPPSAGPHGTIMRGEPPAQDLSLVEGPNVPFSAASLNNWSASRLLFAMDLIKQAPATMVQDNQTPWSHQRLYDDVMPRCLSGTFENHA